MIKLIYSTSILFLFFGCVHLKNVKKTEKNNLTSKKETTKNIKFVNLLLSSKSFRTSEIDSTLLKRNLIRFYSDGIFKMSTISNVDTLSDKDFTDKYYDFSGKYEIINNSFYFKKETYSEVYNINDGTVKSVRYCLEYLITQDFDSTQFTLQRKSYACDQKTQLNWCFFDKFYKVK